MLRPGQLRAFDRRVEGGRGRRGSPGGRRWGLAPFLLGPTRTRARVSALPCDTPAGVRSGDVGEPGTAPAWPAPMNTTCWQGTGELRCALERGAGTGLRARTPHLITPWWSDTGWVKDEARFPKNRVCVCIPAPLENTKVSPPGSGAWGWVSNQRRAISHWQGEMLEHGCPPAHKRLSWWGGVAGPGWWPGTAVASGCADPGSR